MLFGTQDWSSEHRLAIYCRTKRNFSSYSLSDISQASLNWVSLLRLGGFGRLPIRLLAKSSDTVPVESYSTTKLSIIFWIISLLERDNSRLST